jgi:hypothetical protein
VEPIIETADFVEGLLNRRSLAVVYGAPNAGKSFFVSDLAINVALGQPWQDRNIIPGLVIYCALEGTFGINNRIAAFKERSGFDYNGVPFVLLPGGLDLRTSSNDAVYLIELAQQLACEYEMDTALVVIDTVARAMAGGNENASEDMGALIKNLELIAEETGACVLGIHHSGKDETRGARGWSGLRAAIDTEIEVRDAGVLKTATVLKQRDLPKGGQFFFTLEQVTLGQNQWGKDVTSCVVKMAQGMAPINEPKSKNLKGFAKRALEVLKDVIATSGKAGFGCPQNALTVTEDDWRDRFYDTGMVGAAQNVKQKQFKRSSNTLLEQHIVATHAGRVWLVNAKDEPPQPDIPDI